MRKTKIVCTIGPASESEEMVTQLLTAGMDVARLNFSHGTNDEHLARLNRLRQIATKLGKNLGILLDIQGPKIRIGKIKNNRTMLETKQQFVLTTKECIGDNGKAYVSYHEIVDDVKPGNTIYIDDGLLELVVKEVKGPDVICEVTVGGELSSRKGVTLPGIDVKLPSITPEDTEHINFGVKHGVDFIAASFVRRADHVEEVKAIINRAGGDIPVIAKIESDEGLRHIDEIIEVADGVMVARGDLGVEIPPEEVPLAQKMLIKKCNEAGIPVITATQMLDSMIRNPRPTRAEITDVANAIFDGTDCVMLSGETAVGKYPIQAVKMMARIAGRMEQSMDYYQILESQRNNQAPRRISEAIALATSQTAYDLHVNAIICSTQSGQTAALISKFRPRAAILAACPQPEVMRKLSVIWGVHPISVPRVSNIDGMIAVAVNAAKQQDLVKTGDLVTITGGVKTSTPGSTNLLQVYQVE